MPWIDKEDGTREYKVSIYAKEELPTWDEIFHEWFEKKMFFYHPDTESHQKPVPYWNIPYRKYLVMIMCNQFNKMLFEDGYYQPLLDYLNTDEKCKDIFSSTISDIRFVCENVPYLQTYELPTDKDERTIMDIINAQDNEFYKKYKLGKFEAPPIYTIPLPTGEKNPFITDYPRISSDDIKGMISVIPMMKVDVEKDENGHEMCFIPMLDMKHVTKSSRDRFVDMWVTIIEFLIKGIADYFKEPVGWKDKDGNIISNGDPIKRNCTGAGADAAL